MKAANSFSDHFSLYQLAEGIFAAIAKPSGAAFSNAGIIDLGDHVLIFDAMDSPRAAGDLRTAAEKLAGKKTSNVILSHNHFDHRAGLQAFDDNTTIISTHITREIIIEDESDPDFILDEEIQELKEARHAMLNRLENEIDERWRTNLKATVSRFTYSIEALPDIEIKFPNLTFSTRLDFFGSLRSAELIHTGSGHTRSDSWLHLPQDNLAFIGDLGFFECHPFMGDSDPDAWVNQLAEFNKAEIETFVPGHGPVGTKMDIDLIREYIQTLQAMVVCIFNQGGSEEDAAHQDIPAPFEVWSYGINRFESNMRFLFQKTAGKGESSS